MYFLFSVILLSVVYARPNSGGHQGPSVRNVTLYNAEKKALMDLYEQCHGPQWVSKSPTTSNWGTPEICSWQSITCEDDHVVIIDFEQPVMQCQPPASMVGMTQLRSFDIAGQITGPIPTFLQYLTHLHHMKLYQNRISGTLPEFISQLTHLQELAVVPVKGFPGLSGTIPWSYSALKLRILVLDGNSLSGELPLWTIKADFYRIRGNHFTGPCPHPPVQNFGIHVYVSCPGPLREVGRGGDSPTTNDHHNHPHDNNHNISNSKWTWKSWMEQMTIPYFVDIVVSVSVVVAFFVYRWRKQSCISDLKK